MNIPSKNRNLSIVLKTLTFVSAAAGVIITATSSAGTFMGGSRVFMFFTIQSNIAIALVAFVGGVLLLGKAKIGRVWQVIKFVFTVSITLTGAVFTFVLAPTLGNHAWNFQNVLTHVVVPIAAIADFFVVGPFGRLKKRDVFFIVLPPLAYVIYAGIGYVLGWEFLEGIRYPYFFLNWGSPAGAFGFMSGLPYMGTVWWILALLAGLLIVGFLYLIIIDWIKKKHK